MIEAKAVLLDYGNTLVLDPFERILEQHFDYLNEPLRRSGYLFKKASVQDTWKDVSFGIHWPYASHFEQEERFIQLTLGRLNVDPADAEIVAPEMLARYRRKYAEALSGDMRRFEVRDALSKLKQRNKILAVVSNDRIFAPRAAMKYLGVSDLLDDIFISEEIGVEKPDPRVFQHVLERLRVSAGQAVFVGDDPIRDITGAQNVGIQTILYIPPEESRKSTFYLKDFDKATVKPDAVIKNLSELPDLII